MAEVKFKKTTSTNLDSVPVSDGQIVAVTDTGELHIDFDGARTKYGGSDVDLSKNSVRIGEETSSSTDSVVVGYGASTAYSGGVAVGKEATVVSQYGLALGNQAKVDTNAKFAISIGDKAKATHEGAIQLGFGNSKENYSFSVGLGATDNENHLLLRSDGFIPDERLSGNISRSDHTHDAYALKSEIPDTDNFVTQIQAEESYAPLIHSHSEYATLGSLTAVGETASEAKENADSALAQIKNLDIPDTSTFVKYGDIRDEDTNSIVIGTATNAATGSSTGNVIVGPNANAGTSSNVTYATAIGYSAKTSSNNSTALGYSSTASSQYATSIGSESSASNISSTAVGKDASASGLRSTALGFSAKVTATDAIQIGYGTNSTENTFSVGISTSKNYTLLNSNGKIPDDRLSENIARTSQIPTDYLTQDDLENLGGSSWTKVEVDSTTTAISLNLLNLHEFTYTASATSVTISTDPDTFFAEEVSEAIVHFTAGTDSDGNAASFTCTGVKMIGYHCYAGTLTLQKNTRYTIMFSHDGVNMIGTVGGYSIG